MQNALKNWKTTTAGVAVLALSVGAMFGVHVPGFNAPDIGTAITIALGLFVAKDGAVSGTAQ